jgi:hypothetical protein
MGRSTVEADIFSLNGQNAIRWSDGIIKNIRIRQEVL